MQNTSGTVQISVVAPAYRCADCIGEMHRRLTDVMRGLGVTYELIFVEDGSPQDDWARISEVCRADARVRGIRLSRNYGQHFAITAGLDHARGDWVVVMDCDLQDRPEEIPKLWAKAQEGWPVVLARRAQRVDSLYRRLVSLAFAKAYSWLGDINVDHTVANFSICSRRVIDSVCRFRERNRSFPMFLHEVGFAKATVDVEHAARHAGESAYTLSRLFDFAVQSIVSRSNKPLRLSIRFGFVLALGSLVYAGFIVFRYLTHQVPVQGWASLAVLVSFLGGLGFANLGILGLYLGKVFDETKGRPLYVIDTMLNGELEASDER